MKINLQVVVFDAADLNAESTFWARLLSGTVDAEDDWHMVLVNGEPKVCRAIGSGPGQAMPNCSTSFSIRRVLTPSR